MCFSPTASFIASGLTGAVGVACLVLLRRRGDLPLAVMPLMFAAQQGIEGLLWLQLSSAPKESSASALAALFLVFALAVWPFYAPLAAWTAEPRPERRRLMAPCVVLGAVVAGYLLWLLAKGAPQAQILESHIAYGERQPKVLLVTLPYLIAVGAPFLLSSRRALVAFGAVILLGSLSAMIAYWTAFQSVWCYFAALGSVVLLGHFLSAQSGQSISSVQPKPLR